LKKKADGRKINISIIGYGHIGKEVVSGITTYNQRNNDNKINVVNILVKDKQKYGEVDQSFTENPDDLINNISDLVVDLSGDITNSLVYLPRLMEYKKSILIADKILLSDHAELIFSKARENNVRVLIGSCVSSSLPINISKNSPYYDGSDCKEVRGNGSTEVSSAILEDIFYFYS